MRILAASTQGAGHFGPLVPFLESAIRQGLGHIFARLNVRAMLGPIGEAIEEWKPDLILREPAEYASALAAEMHRVPHARVAARRVADEMRRQRPIDEFLEAAVG